MPRRLIQLFAGLVQALAVRAVVMVSAVLAIGWLLGGTVGIGTLVYAGCIGPLAHVFVPLFSRREPREAPARRLSATWPRRRR